MKIACFIFLALSSFYTGHAQTAFIINDIIDPEISHFCDIEYNDGKYFCLSNHVQKSPPYREFSKLYIYNESGVLLENYMLGDTGHQYFQFYKIEGDQIIMTGAIKDTGCLSHLVIAELDVQSTLLHTLTSTPFCTPERIIRRMQFVKGLDGDVFIEGAYGYRISTDNGNRNFVFQVSPTYELTPIFPNLAHFTHFSIDFSQKGYLLKDTYLIDFYDRQFNKRKQRYNFLDDYDNEDGSFSHAFGGKYVLDQVYKNGGNPQGEAIRLLDSNFFIKKLAIITPPGEIPNRPDFPNYGGVAFTGNTIWTTSNLGYSQFDHDPSYISITKLDTGLHILCQQFIGINHIYRAYGISPVETGGCIVFGSHQTNEAQQWQGKEELFAYKVGDQCELLTANEDIKASPLMITAYPNPSTNVIRFDVNQLTASSLRVEFITSNGSVVFSQRDLSREIHVDELAAGQYFYRILDGDKLVGVGSWVKQ